MLTLAALKSIKSSNITSILSTIVANPRQLNMPGRPLAQQHSGDRAPKLPLPAQTAPVPTSVTFSRSQQAPVAQMVSQPISAGRYIPHRAVIEAFKRLLRQFEHEPDDSSLQQARQTLSNSEIMPVGSKQSTLQL